MAAKKKSHTKRKPVPRHTRKYQFRNDHPVDQHAEDILDYWKSGKKEITNLRKAVALYYALEQGDLQELFEAFPQYKAQFAPPRTASAIDGGGQLDEIKSMLEMITAQQQSNNGYLMKSTIQSKPLTIPAAVVMPSTTPVSDDALMDNFLSMFQ